MASTPTDESQCCETNRHGSPSCDMVCVASIVDWLFGRDKERGVVWEESIIMMSKTARFVFLSATIPNAREFAEWIATIHRFGPHAMLLLIWQRRS